MSAFRLWDPQRLTALMSKVRAHCVVWAVKPFAPKWHFLCEYEPILVPNVKCHPRHLHCIHIQRRVKRKLTLVSVIIPYTPYKSIWIRKKNIIHLVRHRYSLCLHLNHIFQALSHRWSLWGRNLADRKLWKRINLTFPCSKKKKVRGGGKKKSRGDSVEGRESREV